MNGMNPTNSLTEFNSNHTYYRSNVGVAHWSNAGRFTATISAEFAASELNKWPAVGFHVSNESNLDRFYVQKGRSTWLPSWVPTHQGGRGDAAVAGHDGNHG